MKNEINIAFCIWEFEDGMHENISAAIGLQPSQLLVKGEPVRATTTTLAKENCWRLESPAIQRNKFALWDEQIDALFQILNEKKEVIKPLCDKYYCEISCGIYIYVDTDETAPSIHLSKSQNALIKDLNIELDIDIILLSDT